MRVTFDRGVGLTINDNASATSSTDAFIGAGVNLGIRGHLRER